MRTHANVLTFPFMVFSTLVSLTSCKSGSSPPPAVTVNFVEPLRVGHATYFDSMGFPAGGCGVPEKLLESPHFVALNVQNTPTDYTSYLARPINEKEKVGIWDNGRNCGRWIRVKVSKNCVDGFNSGEPGIPFCRDGRYEDDAMSGATADFIVADSCQDGNRWCRDDAFHLDLATQSLRNFSKDGQRIADLRGKAWTNRLVEWQFIEAPNYQGDIEIGFIKNAQAAWPAIIVTRLRRGIHGVDVEVNGTWKAARMNSDNGQSYILEGEPPYRLRIYDAYDELINQGRVYEVNFPCQGKCTADYTKANYEVKQTAAPTADVQISTRLREEGGENPSPARQLPPPPPPPAPSPTQSSFKVALNPNSSWDQGSCVNLILSNEGSEPVKNWALWIDTHGATLDQSWNLIVSQDQGRSKLEAGSEWNKTLAPGQRLENAGFCVKGNNKAPSLVKVQP